MRAVSKTFLIIFLLGTFVFAGWGHINTDLTMAQVVNPVLEGGSEGGTNDPVHGVGDGTSTPGDGTWTPWEPGCGSDGDCGEGEYCDGFEGGSDECVLCPNPVPGTPNPFTFEFTPGGTDNLVINLPQGEGYVKDLWINPVEPPPSPAGPCDGQPMGTAVSQGVDTYTATWGGSHPPVVAMRYIETCQPTCGEWRIATQSSTTPFTFSIDHDHSTQATALPMNASQGGEEDVDITISWESGDPEPVYVVNDGLPDGFNIEFSPTFCTPSPSEDCTITATIGIGPNAANGIKEIDLWAFVGTGGHEEESTLYVDVSEGSGGFSFELDNDTSYDSPKQAHQGGAYEIPVTVTAQGTPDWVDLTLPSSFPNNLLAVLEDGNTSCYPNMSCQVPVYVLVPDNWSGSFDTPVSFTVEGQSSGLPGVTEGTEIWVTVSDEQACPDGGSGSCPDPGN